MTAYMSKTQSKQPKSNNKTIQKKPMSPYESKGSKMNNTGIPTQMKNGFESMSRLSFDDVKVHYNSPKPATLQAHAYTQGSDVHIAPGQERHLGHELGHVVQQKQGRVQPTTQLQGVSVNNDVALEEEADKMGAAVQMMSVVQRCPECGDASCVGHPCKLKFRVNYNNGYQDFSRPSSYGQFGFSSQGAAEAVKPLARGSFRTLTGSSAGSGVKLGDCGSYGAVKHLERTGDNLTGDHQPSGAANNEAIRQKLHPALPTPLTRSQAKNAYNKAMTIVVSETWHRNNSRTYGGRNTSTQIQSDASNFETATMADWEKTVPMLVDNGFSPSEIQKIWDVKSRQNVSFFSTGKPQWAYK